MSDTFPMPFGRYQLVERLAVGGMAELYKARVVGAHGFQKPVVIKKILPHLAADASFVAMFIDEAKITSRLDHPKIAQVLELGTIDEQLYIAMEFVEGLDALAVLRACAAKRQPLPTHIAVHIAHEVLDALDYAHQARDDEGRPLGIVHRDISPSNVLISRRGDVKLADFGIAHAAERQQKTQTGTLKGKYGYMSPEQVVGGEIDGRSDLFSVGIVLSEMLMGRRLFTAPNELDVLLMVRDVRLDRLDRYGASIEPSLKAILLKSFEKLPKDRFPSAGAFREALAEWLFANRVRVTPGDLAGFVEGLYGHEQAHPRAETASPAGGGTPVGAAARPPMGTIAGPSTKASQLRAAEAARIAKEVVRAAVEAEEVSAEGSDVSSPGDVGPPPVSVPVVAPPVEPAGKPVRRSPRAPTAAESPRAHSSSAPQVSAPGAPSGVQALGGAQVAAASTPAAAQVRRRPTPSAEIPIILDISEADVAAAVSSLEDTVPAPVDDDLSGPVITIEGPDGGAAAAAALHQSWRPQRVQDNGPSHPGSRPMRDQADFSDLSSDLGLDESTRQQPGQRVSMAEASTLPLLIDSPSAPLSDMPDEEGDMSQTPPLRMLYRLAVDKLTGLLHVEISAISKEIWFAGGVPEFVSSNVARELLGEYLVSQKVISQGELAMALAMMPHFGGKIGDTLVGLGLMKPLDVFRHLTRQVRDKIVDVCTWQKGHYRWYRGKRNPRESFPLGLDCFEVLGAGATSLSAEVVEAWARPMADRAPVAAKNTRVVPEAFRLGTFPREVYNRLDGRLKLRDWIGRFTSVDDRLAFLRTLYLLMHTDLAYWAQ